MSSNNARLIEKDIMEDLTTAGGDSEIVDLNGASKFSCQSVYDVSAPASKTFDSPQTASLTNQSLVYTSVAAEEAANDITIELASPGSGTNPLSISVVDAAISVSLESTAAVAADAALNLNVDVILTSVATGAARNTTTFETQVNAAAANPTDTVLAVFTGTAAAIICTITPNDGTNNGATPVDLTTAELAELISTGAVVGKTVTITDASNLRALQTATGGDATALANGGEGDGVTATFANGANFALVSTGDDVKAAINADSPGAADLVVVSGSNVAALVVLAETNLTGGSDGEVDVLGSSVTLDAASYATGLLVQLTTTGTLPAPLLPATDYFLIVVDAATVQFAETLEGALAGTFIELSDEGSDDAVATVTPEALSGATITYQKSNDGENWANIQAATAVTTDGSEIISQENVSYRYFKVVKAMDAGVFDLNCNILVIGPAV